MLKLRKPKFALAEAIPQVRYGAAKWCTTPVSFAKGGHSKFVCLTYGQTLNAFQSTFSSSAQLLQSCSWTQGSSADQRSSNTRRGSAVLSSSIPQSRFAGPIVPCSGSICFSQATDGHPAASCTVSLVAPCEKGLPHQRHFVKPLLTDAVHDKTHLP